VGALRRAAAGALAALLGGAASGAADPPRPHAPQLEFTPPAPGSYTLQHIQDTPDALLLDGDARRRSLAALTRGKITLLSFFYTYCSDAWGCPYAYATLSGLRERLLAEPALARRVRFVNVSFDPAHDTPEALRRYGAGLAGDARLEWQFLTAPSLRVLLPLLDAYGQDVSIATDALGRPTRTRYHLLKMFLIDARGRVREIYALDYLHPAVMLGDIRTLALEDR
jgi:cytochrome oxidase Cu insertion factor (SCO1/SenC/PrrC family)